MTEGVLLTGPLRVTCPLPNRIPGPSLLRVQAAQARQFLNKHETLAEHLFAFLSSERSYAAGALSLIALFDGRMRSLGRVDEW
jgi:hypothetical protein